MSFFALLITTTASQAVAPAAGPESPPNCTYDSEETVTYVGGEPVCAMKVVDEVFDRGLNCGFADTKQFKRLLGRWRKDVHYAPREILASFDSSGKVPVFVFDGDATSSLFYFAFDRDDDGAHSTMGVAELYGQWNAQKQDVWRELTSVEGYGELNPVRFSNQASSRAAYEGSCLLSFQNALEAGLRFPLAEVQATVGAEFQVQSNLVVVRGKFVSPLYQALHRAASRDEELAAKLALWVHYAQNPERFTTGAEAPWGYQYITGFTGWAMFQTRDARRSVGVDLRTTAAASAAVVSVDSDSTVNYSQASRIDSASFRTLVGDGDVHLERLPSPQDIRDEYVAIPADNVFVGASEGLEAEFQVHVPYIPAYMCDANQWSLYDVVVPATATSTIPLGGDIRRLRAPGDWFVPVTSSDVPVGNEGYLLASEVGLRIKGAPRVEDTGCYLNLGITAPEWLIRAGEFVVHVNAGTNIGDVMLSRKAQVTLNALDNPRISGFDIDRPVVVMNSSNGSKVIEFNVDPGSLKLVSDGGVSAIKDQALLDCRSLDFDGQGRGRKFAVVTAAATVKPTNAAGRYALDLGINKHPNSGANVLCALTAKLAVATDKGTVQRAVNLSNLQMPGWVLPESAAWDVAIVGTSTVPAGMASTYMADLQYVADDDFVYEWKLMSDAAWSLDLSNSVDRPAAVVLATAPGNGKLTLTARRKDPNTNTVEERTTTFDIEATPPT